MSFNCCSYEADTNLSFYVESMLGPAYPTYRVLMTTVILYSLILIFGLLGNACAIVSILRYSRKGCASNLYLLSLSISDLALLVFGLPLELRDTVNAYYPYSLPEFVCPSRAFLIEMSGNVSALTITAFSIQRWLAICFPLKARLMCGFHRTLKVVCGVWILGALGAVPVLLTVKINRLSAPVILDPESAPFIPGTEFCAADLSRPYMELGIIHYSFWTSFIVPLVLIVILYIHIGITIRKTCNKRSPLLRRNRESGQRKSAVRMLAAVATAFFVCWFPFHMQRLLSVYRVGEMVPWVENLYSLLYFISGYFYYANTVVNPILYTILSQRIRRGLISSFRRKSFTSSTYFLKGDDLGFSTYDSGVHGSTFSVIRKSIASVILVAAGTSLRAVATSNGHVSGNVIISTKIRKPENLQSSPARRKLTPEIELL